MNRLRREREEVKAGYAKEFEIPNAKLYQIEGSLNGVQLK